MTTLAKSLTLLLSLNISHGWTSTKNNVSRCGQSNSNALYMAKQKRALLDVMDSSSPISVEDDIDAAYEQEEASAEIIKGFTDEDFYGIDSDVGGVGLAKNSAILISGSADGSAAVPDGLSRYSDIQSINEIKGNVVCKGFYKGDSETEFDFATKAASVALSTTPNFSLSNSQGSTICINICGGDELLLRDSLDAANAILKGLDFPDDSDVRFNSLSDSRFEIGAASIVVVVSDEGDSKVFEFGGNYYELTSSSIVEDKE